MARRMMYLGAFLVLTLMHGGCAGGSDSLESISLDYPHGEDRLLVLESGEALLFYGSRPESRRVKDGIFDVHELYVELQPRLHDNVPREEWPDPKAVAGMVTIKFEGRAKQDFLIFNEEEFAESLFAKAEANIIEEPW